MTDPSPSPSPPPDKGSAIYLTAICLIAALGGLLFGYDTAVINNAIGFLETHFRLDSTMKGFTAASALLGCVIGVSFAGVFSDRLGRKKTLVLAGILFLVSSVGTAVPKELWQFILFRVLGGVGVGIASMASPMYIAEITPARIRGRMVSVNQFAIVSGMLLIYFVNYEIAVQGDDAWKVSTSWRWMFASGIAPSGLFLFLLLFAPESPRWLLKQGREESARTILGRVGGVAAARDELASIRETLHEESGSLGQLLQPGMRRALGLGIALAVLQQITGINAFLYFGTEMFKGFGENLGLDVDVAHLQMVAVGAVNLLFTIVAIWTVDRIGRKPLMVIGSCGMGICLAAMGGAAQLQTTSTWHLVFVLGYIASFALSVGPVTWVILSEIFPNRIRGRALSIATFCLWTANFIVTQTFAMMDKSAWLLDRFHHAFPFYIYGAFCVVLVVVVARWVPETKGKSLEEIEAFWQKRRK